MKKIIMLLIFMMLITGCSVKYKLTINEDLSLQEEAKLTGTDDFFSVYYKTSRTKVLKSFIEIYQDILNENGYSYELIEETIPYVFVKKTYNGVNEYINSSKLFNGYFDEIKYTEDGNIKRIETEGFNDNNSDDPERFNVRELEISITCPFDVKNHNAKKVDKKTNTYYYELSNDNKILLEYDTSKKFNPNKDRIQAIMLLILAFVAIWIGIIIANMNKNK